MREQVTREQLLEVLNKRVSETGTCAHVRIIADRLAPGQPDEFGCNWRRADLLMVSDGSISYLCCEWVRKIVWEATREFNIVTEETLSPTSG